VTFFYYCCSREEPAGSCRFGLVAVCHGSRLVSKGTRVTPAPAPPLAPPPFPCPLYPTHHIAVSAGCWITPRSGFLVFSGAGWFMRALYYCLRTFLTAYLLDGSGGRSLSRCPFRLVCYPKHMQTCRDTDRVLLTMLVLQFCSSKRRSRFFTFVFYTPRHTIRTRKKAVAALAAALLFVWVFYGSVLSLCLYAVRFGVPPTSCLAFGSHVPVLGTPCLLPAFCCRFLLPAFCLYRVLRLVFCVAFFFVFLLRFVDLFPHTFTLFLSCCCCDEYTCCCSFFSFVHSV